MEEPRDDYCKEPGTGSVDCKDGPLGRPCSSCQPRMRQRSQAPAEPGEHGGGPDKDRRLLKAADAAAPSEGAGTARPVWSKRRRKLAIASVGTDQR